MKYNKVDFGFENKLKTDLQKKNVKNNHKILHFQNFVILV